MACFGTRSGHYERIETYMVAAGPNSVLIFTISVLKVISSQLHMYVHLQIPPKTVVVTEHLRLYLDAGRY